MNQGTSRADKKERLKECRLGKLDARIAEQKRILAALNEILAEQQMQIDEQGRILNELDQEIARVVAINGKLLIRRQQAEANQVAILDRVERYILENS